MKVPYHFPHRKIIAIVIVVVFFIYYPLGTLIFHHIDDSTSIDTKTYEKPNSSVAVATAITLIDREVNKHHWTPNDPFFYPTAMMVRMPAFQRGIMTTMARFAIELNDQLGRSRSSSQADPDLQKAMGLLNYSPNVWMWDFKVSIFPTASSEKQYNEGLKALVRYNERLSSGTAVFERRSDNLMSTLDRINSDLGSASSALDTHIQSRSGFVFGGSADLFYFTKGRMYGNYMLLKGLEKDFAPLLEERQLTTIWNGMLDSLAEGINSNHFLVINASPKDSIFANHLANQGFYLVRARGQMREITDILLK